MLPSSPGLQRSSPVHLLPQPPLRVLQVGGAVAAGNVLGRLRRVKLRGALQEGRLKVVDVDCRVQSRSQIVAAQLRKRAGESLSLALRQWLP